MIFPRSSTERLNIYFFLTLCAACLTFRQMAIRLPDGYYGLPALWDLSILHFWVWYELLISSSQEKMLAGPLVSGLFLIFFVICCVLYPDVVFSFEVISSLGLICYYKRGAFSVPLAASFATLVLSGLMTSSLFSFLHSRWAFIDAFVVWLSLYTLGSKVLLEKTVLHLQGSDHSIIVEATCASTWVLVLPITCFLIVTFCRQKAFGKQDMGRFLLACSVIFILNIFRLSKMLPSREAWDYWHFGFGSSIFALVSALIVFSLVRGRPNV